MMPFNIADCGLRIADSKPHAQTFTIIRAPLHGVTPVAVLEIPLHRFPQAVFDGVTGGPSKLAANFRRVDGVAAIVPRAIGDEGLQRPPAFAARPRLVDDVADAVDDLEIRPLVAAAD